MDDSFAEGAGGSVVTLDEGRRSRKRRLTRQRIANEGFRLFVARGFEATTIEAIAEASEISRRTFFHYFASKEDAVFGWMGEFTEAAVEAMEALPGNIAPIQALETVLIEVAHRYETDEVIAIDRLLRSAPALMARKLVHHAQQEQELIRAMSRKWPALAREADLSVVAIAGVGVLRTAAERWTAEGRSARLEAYIEEGFRALHAQLDLGKKDVAASIRPSAGTALRGG